MNIMFVAGSLRAGGKERRMGELIRSLKQTGKYKIYLVLYVDVFDYKYVEDSIDGKYIIDRDCSRYQTFKGLYNYIKKVKPAIVHVWTIRACLYLNIIRLFIKFKYILGTVADANKCAFATRMVHKLAYPLCDLVISNSKAGLIAYEAPKKKSKVIYNGFNKDRLNPNETGERIKKEFCLEGKKVITMVARLEPSKDFKMYIDVARLVNERTKETKFLIVGKGPNEESLKQYAKESSADNVIFCGYRTDVEAIYKASDIAALCTNSEVHAEGVSNSIMEAMACGIPVVATIGGGTPEIVKDEYNGHLVEPKDSLQMANKIVGLIEDNCRRKTYGKNAIDTIEERFTIEKMSADYLEVYANI